MPRLVTLVSCSLLALACGAAAAAPVRYTLDPDHTFPSFEADHMGLSFWRGKFNASHGTLVLDREAGGGSVDVTIDIASVDFGQEKLNQWARGSEFFDTTAHPVATYHGRLAGFSHGAPTRVEGELTLNGSTHPLTLAIDRFKCMPHPIEKRELCGADATGRFDRSAYGLTAGKDYGFDMSVALRIQVEALRDK
jgi:polyisoprenoid-binding protein YceI